MSIRWPKRQRCPTTLPASAFRDGSLLREVSSIVARALGTKARTNLPRGLDLVWGSACTGSGMDYWIGDGLRSSPPLQPCAGMLAFVCEKDPKKRAWLRRTLPSSVCIFEDVNDLAAEEAQCARHDKRCKITHADGFKMGFSCKDASRANNKRSFDCLSTGSGGGLTASSFHGGVAYINHHRPLLILLENVDGLADDAAVGSPDLAHGIYCSLYPHLCWRPQQRAPCQ